MMTIGHSFQWIANFGEPSVQLDSPTKRLDGIRGIGDVML